VLGRNFFAIPVALFEGLEQETPPAEAIDELSSELIAAYEQALQKGVSPSCALEAMLNFVSEECQRCAADSGS
jgi:hypothetical protein